MGKQIFRASWHDYRQACKYLITLSKAKGIPAFGELARDVVDGSCYIKSSAIGSAIKQALKELSQRNSAIQVYQYVIMPDHIHVLLRVHERLAFALGYEIAAFKVSVNKYSGYQQVFERGFNDQIIHPGRSLDVVFNYIRQNPYRLAVRRERPEFFRRVNGLKVAGKDVQAYGSMFLLRNPFKEQVVVHRADSEAVRTANIERWLYTAANGGVLVSPFISKAEKEVRRRAEEEGGRFILLINESMAERYKPSGHDFNLCEQGRLLIISYPHPQLDRAACLALNAMAQQLTNNQS